MKVLNWARSRINCNKSAQIFSWHIFQMPMGDTNVTPTSLNPSRLATIKSWAAESPPSRKTLVVLHVRHNQLFHRHIGQHCSCWCWFRFSTLPPINRFTIPVRVSSGIWHAYPKDTSILPYGRRLQIRVIIQSNEQQHPETEVGNMQHFWGQDLESRLKWMLSGDNDSSLSVPHEIFFNSCVYKSAVQDALSWWKTNEFDAFLIGRGIRSYYEGNASLVFLSYETRVEFLGDCSKTSPRTGGESWISCISSWDNTCVATILKNVCPFLERSLINLKWFGEFPIDNFDLLLIRLDKTVQRLLFITGLNTYELAVKLVQLVHVKTFYSPSRPRGRTSCLCPHHKGADP